MTGQVTTTVKEALGWPLLGCLLLASALVLPWFAIPLEADRSAFSLPLALAGVPAVPGLSYGAAIGVCLVLAVSAARLTRGRPNAGTAGLGLVVLVISLAFVVASGTSDSLLLQHLRDQTAERIAIFSQFGYAVPNTEPRLMLGVPVTGEWVRLAAALRLGWLTAAAGGLVLLLSGGSQLAHARRAGWRELLPATLALLVTAGLVGLVGRGVAAGVLLERGVEAARSGDTAAARASLAQARTLDPALPADARYELAVGQTLLAAGRDHDPLALLADAASRGAAGDVRQQVADLQEATGRAPGDPVLRQQVRQASRQLALARGDVAPLQGLGPRTAADEYTEGRILYRRADYAAALDRFRRVLGLTADPNALSSAYTYVSLSETRLGESAEARHDLLRAVAVDTAYNNVLARSMAAGLYVATRSGEV